MGGAIDINSKTAGDGDNFPADPLDGTQDKF